MSLRSLKPCIMLDVWIVIWMGRRPQVQWPRFISDIHGRASIGRYLPPHSDRSVQHVVAGPETLNSGVAVFGTWVMGAVGDPQVVDEKP